MTANLTPMIQQYMGIKSAHRDHLLFYRLGDFYELFFEDAKVASQILEIVLTKRGAQNGDNIPMCGVPHHSATHYINKLLKNGHSIAICEQLESPEEAKKRGYKAVVKREVVQIITPGTLMEDNLLDPKSMNYLMAVAEHKNTHAVAWIELSTGEFYTSNCCSRANIVNEISRLNPNEIIISQKHLSASEFLNIQTNFTPRSHNVFDYQSCCRKIEEYYKISSTEGLGNFSQAQIIAAGVLIEYIVHTQKSNLPKLKVLKNMDRAIFMEIDAATRRNLELETNNSENKKFTLLNTIDRTITSAGARLLKTRLSSPLCNAAVINKRLECIDFFFNAKELRDNLRKYLVYFPDIQRSMARIFINKATFKNLNIIKDGLKIATMISDLFRVKEVKLTDGINAIISQIFGYSKLVMQLEEAIMTCEEVIEGQGAIRNGYNKQLDELYDIKNNSHQKISHMRDKYRQKTGVQNLKIVRNNILGYFVEVTNMNAGKLEDASFIHKQTLGNYVRYFTNELKELEDILLNCDNRIASVEKEIFDNLCNQVKEHFDEISLVVTSIANLDLYSALAELASEENYVRPYIDDSNTFEIEGGRHPVVERFQKEKFIPNSCAIYEQEKIWLITGPNMAGKSTFLRQNALICILAQMGSYVPAAKVNLGVVDKLFSRIGAADNIAKGESTFMVEMIETAYILNNATEKSFVILDEIGRGTSTHDGISIAWAVLEYLHNSIRCRTLFATHYHELIELKRHLPNVATYTMEIKEWNGEIIFMHKILSGVADSSYGVHVAELAGLPSEVIKIAQKILCGFESSHGLEVKINNTQESPINNTQESEIISILKHTDINNITPIKAHEILFNLKAKIQ